MWRITVSLVTISLLVQVKASPDISLEDLLDRLVTLEDWKRETENEVTTLRETLTQQEIVIKNLERQLAIQANITATLQSYQQENNPDTHEQRVETEDETIRDGQLSNDRIRTTDPHNQTPVHPSTVNKRQLPGGVAFTAYLDHFVDLGVIQKIKFNQIFTNDGNAYDVHTGVFTCPKAGVYLFSFSLGDINLTSGRWKITAKLVVNNQPSVAGIVFPLQHMEALQGGNTVIVRLDVGDLVWVDGLYSGERVESTEGLIFTTFSGVHLYA